MSTEATEEQVDYAYTVFNTVKTAIDKATVNPGLTVGLGYELVQKMPELFDAMMAIVRPEHRQLMFELSKAAMKLVREWQTKKI